ncbi:hypothetical protein HKW98_04760 [Stutzerimonas urumqiensis]|uniref:LysR substrate-binding domain-containing protein n=1 Tax=Stutzerimonas urumqiensis TaxID=638269 RepID=UPI003BA865D4
MAWLQPGAAGVYADQPRCAVCRTDVAGPAAAQPAGGAGPRRDRLPSGDPLLGRASITFADLARYPLASSQLPERVARSVREDTGRDTVLSIQCDNFLLLLKLTEQSDTLCISPRDVVQEALNEGRLVELEGLSEQLRHRSAYGLVSRRGHRLSPAGEAFRAQLLGD